MEAKFKYKGVVMKNMAHLSSLMNSRISCSSLSSIIRSLREKKSREGDRSEGGVGQWLEWYKHANKRSNIL